MKALAGEMLERKSPIVDDWLVPYDKSFNEEHGDEGGVGRRILPKRLALAGGRFS